MAGKLTSGGKIPRVTVGKGSRQEFLPSRHALNTLTKGTPFQRSAGWYAKLTPSGLGAPSTYAAIQQMGEPDDTEK